MEFYYKIFQQLEDVLASCHPDSRSSVNKSMMEAAAKLRDSARIHSIAKCRLEVAAPLYLIFKMMIQVM